MSQCPRAGVSRPCPVSLLHARAYAHATEDPERVLRALENVVRGHYTVRDVRGHYGNVIRIIEVRAADCEALEALKSIVSRLDDLEFQLLLLGAEGSRLYVRFDKQHAYRGALRVSGGDDVIHVEVHCRSTAGGARSFLARLREELKGAGGQ